MKDELFIQDRLAEFGTINESMGIAIKFKDYKLWKRDGQQCIVGVGAGTRGTFNSYDDLNLFFSLVSLVKGPLPEEWGNPEPLQRAIPTNGIIKWCKKNGLPFYDWNLYKKHRVDGFKLSWFRREIAELKRTFLIWRGLFEEDEELIMKWIPGDGNYEERVRFAKILLPNWLTKLRISGVNETEKLTGATIGLIYDEAKSTFRLAVQADSLLEIAHFQSALLFTKRGDDRHLKICDVKDGGCGSYFWATHGNQKGCCNPKTMYSRRKKLNIQ